MSLAVRVVGMGRTGRWLRLLPGRPVGVVLDQVGDERKQGVDAVPVVALVAQGLVHRPEPVQGGRGPVPHLVEQRCGDQVQAFGEQAAGSRGRGEQGRGRRSW